MAPALRPATGDDWPDVLAVAIAAAPHAPDGNKTWLEARRTFDESRHPRRHYVVSAAAAGIVGYGGIEGDGHGRFRVFVVTAAKRLHELGAIILDQLESDLLALGAASAWAREEAGDPVLDLLRDRGFTSSGQFVLADSAGAYAGVEVAVLERLSSVRKPG